MKKYIYLLVVFSIILFSGCKFSKGFKTEPLIGLSYTYNGFGLKEVKLFDTYNKPLGNNKLPENSILYIRVDGFKNYTVTDGKVFLGCKLTVADKDDKVIFEEEDLYSKDSIGQTPEVASVQIIKVRLSDPIVAGKNYKVKVHLSDKHNKENVLDIEVDVELTPSEVKINHEEKGLSFSNMTFSQKDLGVLPQNIVRQNSVAAIVLYGLKGFTEENGKVFPACSLVVTDKSGKVYLEYKDLFESYTDGVEPEKVKEIFYTSVTFADPIIAGKDYNVAIHITDRKNKENEIKADMDVQVIN